MRRHGIPSLFLVGTALLLGGCSLLPLPFTGGPQGDGGSSDGLEISPRDLDDLFDPDDAPRSLDIEMDFSSSSGEEWADEIDGYWDDSEGSNDDCYDSYVASFLLGGADDDEDKHVTIAMNNSESDYDYLSVDARVFADAAAAQDFFGVVADASEECDDAGGYELSSEGTVIWEVSGVDAYEADELDLPDGVAGFIQEEDVDRDFADSYRVIMLQRANVIVSITVQPADDGGFEADDGDELAELVAEQLAELD